MADDIQSQMPERIGRFEILEELGEGAMSVVYKAFDPEIHRTLAIKLLRGEWVNDPEYRYRFLTEAKAAGNLAHPNIVTVFDVGECAEGPFIAMEYVEGSTLEQMLESGRRFSLRDALTIGIQLAEALNYSHERGVVHRDIKPSNVIGLEDGLTIRITDFGIAHIESTGKEQHTQLGMVLGTPQYMSPEQVEGLPVDGRSDLFSVGVILYQLITGEKPFAADTLTSLLMKIVQEEPAPITKQVPDLLPSMQKLVEKLLQKDPEKRFQSGEELAGALRNVIIEVDEKDERRLQGRIMPLRVKWTLAMAVAVASFMVLGIFLVQHKQVQAMTRLAVDFGGSLAKFIAVESAEAILIQDWVAIDTFVKETEQRQEISYLRIVDYKGIIRGSSQAGESGRPFQPATSLRSLSAEAGVEVSEVSWQGAKTFDFGVPILFQGRDIGRVQLGLSQASLRKAADLTLYTMLALLIALVLMVVVVAYLLAARLSMPIQVLKRAMQQIARGGYGYRIEDERNDELGQLFIGFNRMAESLEHKQDETEILVGREETRREYVELSGNEAGAELEELGKTRVEREEEVADEPTRVMRPGAGPQITEPSPTHESDGDEPKGD